MRSAPRDRPGAAPVPAAAPRRGGVRIVAATAAVCLASAAFAAKPLDYICYSPYRDGQRPGGPDPSEAQIRADLALIAPFAKGIRTYTCSGIHAKIPALAREAGLEVYLGAWIGADDAANLKEMDALIQAARAGNPPLKGLIVGNEVLLRQDVSKARLIEYLKRVRQAGVGLPVTTADIYQRIGDNSADLDPVVDYVLCHVHPFWENVAAADGAKHVLKGWQAVKAKYPGKTVMVGETGFPTGGQTRDAAVPSEAAQARFAEDLARLAAENGMPVMFFEAFDEAWKGDEGPVGAHWGLWKRDRTEKPAVAKLRAPASVALAPGPRRAGPRAMPLLRVNAAGRLLLDAPGDRAPARGAWFLPVP